MSRGLPYSIVAHVLGLALVLVFGNSVSRVQVQPPHSIRVQMVQMPRLPERPQEKPPEALPDPVPEVRPEPVAELPPKEVPKAKPVDKVPEKPKPEPEKKDPPKPQEAAVDPPADTPAESEALAVPDVGGPSIEGTDVDFPFAWYLAQVKGQIARNWNPKQLGFRNKSVVSCTVHFTIARNGAISRITLTQASGVGVFDREALRTVQMSRIPPLPPAFTDGSLGITLKFNLESGV